MALTFAQPSKVRLDSSDPSSPEISVVHSDDFDTIEVPPDFRFRVTPENVDPVGFFYTWVHKSRKVIQLFWFKYLVHGVSAKLLCVYEGQNAPSIYDFVITNYPNLSPANAVALGYDLAQAEMELNESG